MKSETIHSKFTHSLSMMMSNIATAPKVRPHYDVGFIVVYFFAASKFFQVRCMYREMARVY